MKVKYRITSYYSCGRYVLENRDIDENTLWTVTFDEQEQMLEFIKMLVVEEA